MHWSTISSNHWYGDIIYATNNFSDNPYMTPEHQLDLFFPKCGNTKCFKHFLWSIWKHNEITIYYFYKSLNIITYIFKIINKAQQINNNILHYNRYEQLFNKVYCGHENEQVTNIIGDFVISDIYHGHLKLLNIDNLLQVINIQPIYFIKYFNFCIQNKVIIYVNVYTIFPFIITKSVYSCSENTTPNNMAIFNLNQTTTYASNMSWQYVYIQFLLYIININHSVSKPSKPTLPVVTYEMHLLSCLINNDSDNSWYFDRIFNSFPVSEGETESSGKKLLANESVTIFNPLLQNTSIFKNKFCNYKLFLKMSDMNSSLFNFIDRYGVILYYLKIYKSFITFSTFHSKFYEIYTHLYDLNSNLSNIAYLYVSKYIINITWKNCVLGLRSYFQVELILNICIHHLWNYFLIFPMIIWYIKVFACINMIRLLCIITAKF